MSNVEYGVRIYDSVGDMSGHLGRFGALSDQIEAFGRAREEILKRIEVEGAQIVDADRSIGPLIVQRNKSLDEQARLQDLLENLPEEIGEEEAGF